MNTNSAVMDAGAKGFQPGKVYRHKRDFWEGIYVGTDTMPYTCGLDDKGNLKYKMLEAHVIEVTKPGIFTYSPMGVVGQWTGLFKFEECELVEPGG